MRTTYTLAETRVLLGGIDRETLTRWLRAARLPPRRDHHDHRKWRLARWQIIWVAALPT